MTTTNTKINLLLEEEDYLNLMDFLGQEPAVDVRHHMNALEAAIVPASVAAQTVATETVAVVVLPPEAQPTQQIRRVTVDENDEVTFT